MQARSSYTHLAVIEDEFVPFKQTQGHDLVSRNVQGAHPEPVGGCMSSRVTRCAPLSHDHRRNSGAVHTT